MQIAIKTMDDNEEDSPKKMHRWQIAYKLAGILYAHWTSLCGNNKYTMSLHIFKLFTVRQRKWFENKKKPLQ